jgi:hypothetical protein
MMMTPLLFSARSLTGVDERVKTSFRACFNDHTLQSGVEEEVESIGCA